MQDIDIRRLRYFSRIALDGSLTRAAGVLAIAQPALSRQMRVLEESLGVPLFRRSARGMRLTEEGDYLLTAIAGPLRELDLAVQNVRASSTRVRGDFAVGMPSGVNDAIGRDLALQVHERYPDVRLKLVEGITGSLLDWIGRGIIDMAILEAPSDDDRFDDIAILDAPLMLVGPRSDAGAHGGEVAFAAALAMPLVLPAHHLGIRYTLSTAAAAARLPLVARCETDSPRLALELVDAGLGHAILPGFLVPDRANHALRTLTGADLRYRLYMTSRKDRAHGRNRVDRPIMAFVTDLVEARSLRQAGGRSPARKQIDTWPGTY